MSKHTYLDSSILVEAVTGKKRERSRAINALRKIEFSGQTVMIPIANERPALSFQIDAATLTASLREFLGKIIPPGRLPLFPLEPSAA